MHYHKHIYWDKPYVGDDEIDSVTESISGRWVGGNGPAVECLQDMVAERLGVNYVLATNNGTSALLVALQAVREIAGPLTVAIPAYTFIASLNTASVVTSSIHLMDCNPATWNIDRDRVPWDKINCLMPVDVGGLPCPYNELTENTSIVTIADSAESLGANYKGRPVGSQCDAHCFSLHRAKIVTAGEGGLVTTNDVDLYKIMVSIANHGYAEATGPHRGQPWRQIHSRVGFNYRMTDLEAAVALAQMNRLDAFIQERQHKAKIYREILEGVVTFQDDGDGEHPYFFFGIVLQGGEDIDWFCEDMLDRGISCKTWTAVNRQPVWKESYGHHENAERLSDRVVLLPIGNTLVEDDIEHVAKVARGLLC